jgi:hypothetical protein
MRVARLPTQLQDGCDIRRKVLYQISEELNRSGANICAPMALSWNTIAFTDSKICPNSIAAIDKINKQISKNPKHLNMHVQKQLAVLPASALAQVSPTTSRDIAVTLTVISNQFESMMLSDQRRALFHECFRRVTFGVLLQIKASTCCIAMFFFCIVFTT